MSEYNNEGVCQLYKPFILPQFLTWDKGTLFLPKDASSSATKKMSRERSRPKPDRSSLPTCLWHLLKITVLPVAVCFFHWAHTKCCFIMNLITMPQFSPMLKQSGTWEQTHWSISVLPVTGYSETQDSYVLLTTDQFSSAVFHCTLVCPPTHSSHTEAYPFYEAGFSKYFTVPKDDVSTFGTDSQSTGVCWVPFQTCHSPVKGTCSSKKTVWGKRTQKSQLQSLSKR